MARLKAKVEELTKDSLQVEQLTKQNAELSQRLEEKVGEFQAEASSQELSRVEPQTGHFFSSKSS